MIQRTLRMGVYARYSTDEQDKESTADQMRVARRYAANNGGQVVGEYADEGISGSAIGNRPGLQRILSDAYAGKLDVIVVTDLSRLARSEDLPKLIQQLRFRDVVVVGVQDGFNSGARTARMQAGLAAIMGAEFIEMVRARTYSALEMRAQQERPTGGKAYGYDKDRTPCEPEASIVREIFKRFAAGDPMKAIAADLNARAVPSPGSTWKRKSRRTDGRWLFSGIHSILHNELYIGRVIWNRREFRKDPDTGKRTCRERPRDQWKEYQDDSRVIVDRALWDRCQARLGGRAGRIRELLVRCGLGQRAAARELGIDERTMRYWCSGEYAPPPMAFLALEHIAERTSQISEGGPTLLDPQDVERWARINALLDELEPYIRHSAGFVTGSIAADRRERIMEHVAALRRSQAGQRPANFQTVVKR